MKPLRVNDLMKREKDIVINNAAREYLRVGDNIVKDRRDKGIATPFIGALKVDTTFSNVDYACKVSFIKDFLKFADNLTPCERDTYKHLSVLATFILEYIDSSFIESVDVEELLEGYGYILLRVDSLDLRDLSDCLTSAQVKELLNEYYDSLALGNIVYILKCKNGGNIHMMTEDYYEIENVISPELIEDMLDSGENSDIRDVVEIKDYVDMWCYMYDLFECRLDDTFLN